MNHYVYLITNSVNNKKYIGDRSCNCNLNKDLYMGSGLLIKKALKKYGIDSFEKNILEKFETKEESFKSQEKYIKKYNTLVPNGYNISPTGGVGVPGSYHNEETKQKISNSNKGKNTWAKGSKKSEEFKERARKQMIGNTIQKGKNRSFESKIKYSNSKQGIKNPMFGMNGSKNPRYDFTLYKFKNKITGEIIECTKFELSKKLNTISSSIIRIINKKRTHYKNWILYD
jgi:group I intron endonuclease